MSQGAEWDGSYQAHLPNYSFAEASRYLRMPPSTVRYWAKGGTVTTPQRRVDFRQVLEGPPRQRLTFLDLTELVVVRDLRVRFNLSLGTIRRVQEYVRKELGQPWYLYDLRVRGRDIFIMHLEKVPVAATRSGQMAFANFLEDLLERVEADAAGVPSRIFPRLDGAHVPKPVQISPIVSFGYPTVAGTGIKTRTIASRYDAGEDIDFIARDYELPRESILDAIAFNTAA